MKAQGTIAWACMLSKLFSLEQVMLDSACI